MNEKVASAIAKLEEAGLTPEACETFVVAHHIRVVVVDCARDSWNLNLCDFEAIHGLPDLKDLNNL